MSRRLLLIGLASVLVFGAKAPGRALAMESGPGWEIASTSIPSTLPAGGQGALYLQPKNIGAAATAGGEGSITIVDELPEGVIATAAGDTEGWTEDTLFDGSTKISEEFWDCDIDPGPRTNSIVTCHNGPALPTVSGGGGTIGTTHRQGESSALQPGILIDVEIDPDRSEVGTNSMQISGGGASPVSATSAVTIGNVPAAFGVTLWNGWFSNRDGTLDTQAGSVPYAATFLIDFSTTIVGSREVTPHPVVANAGGQPRDLVVALPPGFVGNPAATPQCTRRQFDTASGTPGGACPPGSQVGLFKATFAALGIQARVFNLQTPEGLPAEFGLHFEHANGFLNASLRTGDDYGIDTTSPNILQKLLLSGELVLWGVPADPSHNVWRTVYESGCERGSDLVPGGSCNLGAHPALKPFLRLPTNCEGPPQFSVAASSWSDPSDDLTKPITFETKDVNGAPVGLSGCNRLPFEPSITASPTTDFADAPTGLEFDLRIPQPEGVRAVEGEALNPEEAETPGEIRTIGAESELHEADLKDAIVTLPRGIAVNPASANGLSACTPAQIGLASTAGQSPVKMTPAPAACPGASKIGSVEIDTPLLKERNEAGEPTSSHPLTGGVYVASPQSNPFGSLLAIYIAVDDPSTGTVIKLPGKVEANPVDGQLTASFDEDPQLPFEDFHLKFFEGSGAALRTPSVCGTYQVASTMTPWSTPEGADGHPSDSFAITKAPGGGACPTTESQLPNSPTFTAGTIAPKAGAYSPFVLHLARADGTQQLTKIETTLPEGLLAKLAGVSECSDQAIAQAAARNKIGEGALEQAHPSCPQSSEVGTVHVGAGAGPTPYYVSGRAYLAGPYRGAPLSLVIVTPAVAGPYDLGNVVVRTALKVDPLTAQVDAVSDELPHILQGIPLDIRSIDLELGRNQFTLNPTSCAAKSIDGAATALGDSSAALSVPFQVGECKDLAFKPKLKLTLKGSTRHAGHPALKAVLTYPKGGGYANIARAQVNLPHSEFIDQGNLNKACTKPVLLDGACPSSTVYGHAKAWTPLEEAPLEGPVFLVGGFGYKLPALVAELNGQIRVLLAGKVDSGPNHGIRNTFEAVPDAPVEKFELQLKGGPKYSLLENSEDLCRKPQKAIASFTAQNGLVQQMKVPMGVRCPRAKAGSKGKGKSKVAKKQRR